jgi:molybdopterin-binding protein
MLTLDHISKSFTGFHLEDISFTVEKGDYFILLGESGAGKSVLLELIAGLIPCDRGTMMLNGTEITRTRIHHRKIGLVFQDHAIFPHLTVKENIEYALHGRKLEAGKKNEMVNAIATLMGIQELFSRKPSSLSGGEVQRVALARTLIQEPEVLLLDEPLASLDTRIKSDLRAMLREIHRNGQTILHVTHDYEEALSLGSRVAVIDHGKILQTGTPEEVFRTPKSEFVAHFVGVKNFFPAKILRENDRTFGIIGEGLKIRCEIDDAAVAGYLIIPSEDIFISKENVESSALNNFQGTVREIIPAARGMELKIDIGIPMHALITRESVGTLGIVPGSAVWIHFKATAVRFIRTQEHHIR